MMQECKNVIDTVLSLEPKQLNKIEEGDPSSFSTHLLDCEHKGGTSIPFVPIYSCKERSVGKSVTYRAGWPLTK